jgi:MarR family transcriptional regulator, organic hydroperoxide resistance regulator
VTSELNVSDSLLLDDQMCFALYAASRAVTAVYRPLLDDLGLTYPQYLVMLVLWDRGSCPVKEIAVALHLDYGTLTPLLKRLETAGYLRRQRRRGDERTVDIVLTAAGEDLSRRARPVPAAISRAMALSTADTAALRGLLRQLTDNLRAAEPAAPPAP